MAEVTGNLAGRGLHSPARRLPRCCHGAVHVRSGNIFGWTLRSRRIITSYSQGRTVCCAIPSTVRCCAFLLGQDSWLLRHYFSSLRSQFFSSELRFAFALKIVSWRSASAKNFVSMKSRRRPTYRSCDSLCPKKRRTLFRFLELKLRKVHLAFGKDVNRENASTRGKIQLHERRHDVPVVPLPPRQRLRPC